MKLILNFCLMLVLIQSAFAQNKNETYESLELKRVQYEVASLIDDKEPLLKYEKIEIIDQKAILITRPQMHVLKNYFPLANSAHNAAFYCRVIGYSYVGEIGQGTHGDKVDKIVIWMSGPMGSWRDSLRQVLRSSTIPNIANLICEK